MFSGFQLHKERKKVEEDGREVIDSVNKRMGWAGLARHDISGEGRF